MSSFSYKGLGHFPFHILRDQLPDGRPFIHIDNWNGTTFFDGLPSGSSVDWLPVYGPGAPYCLPMTEWEFSIYYWRQRTIKTEFDVSITVPGPSASASLFSDTASASLGAMTPDLEYSNGEKFTDNRVERKYAFALPLSIEYTITALKEGQLVSPQGILQSYQTVSSSQPAQKYERAVESKIATDADIVGQVSAQVDQQISIQFAFPAIDPADSAGPISGAGSWIQSRNFGDERNVIIVAGTYWLRFPLVPGSPQTGSFLAGSQARADGDGVKSKSVTRALDLNAWGSVASVPANATAVTEGLVDVEWRLPGSIVTGQMHFLSYLITTSINTPGTGAGTQTISAPDPTIVVNKITVTPTEYLTYGGKFNATTGL